MSAAAVSELNPVSRSTTLEPYGQLIRMLMPRAQSIAIYDRMGIPAWMSDGRDVPELRRLLEESLSAELRPGERSTGRMQPMDDEHGVYVFLLRDGEGTLVGAAGVVCREIGSTSGWRTWARARSCATQSSAVRFRGANTAGGIGKN